LPIRKSLARVALSGLWYETQATLLKVSGLARSFGRLSVLENINLEIHPGELVSIAGPNGAGKTTLIRCLSDGFEPFRGVVEIAGKSIKSLTPDRVVSLGSAASSRSRAFSKA
jgi:urea transport system permease protein/urea transport system ATP-binding protein